MKRRSLFALLAGALGMKAADDPGLQRSQSKGPFVPQDTVQWGTTFAKPAPYTIAGHEVSPNPMTIKDADLMTVWVVGGGNQYSLLAHQLYLYPDGKWHRGTVNGQCPVCGTMAPPYKPTSARFCGDSFYVDPDTATLRSSCETPVQNLERCSKCSNAFW